MIQAMTSSFGNMQFLRKINSDLGLIYPNGVGPRPLRC